MMISVGAIEKLAIFSDQKIEGQQEWIFFGGSFHPWHQGHSSCLNLLWEQEQKEAIIIPDHNPQKDTREVTDAELFCQDLAKAIRSQTDAPFAIYGDFLKENKKNPSYNWISKLKEKHPEQLLSLLLGNDSFIGLDSWIQWRELLKKLDHLYVASRKDDKQITQKKTELYRTLNPRLSITFLGPHAYENLSSSKIRKATT